MARNFPEVWVGRVENNLKTTDEAPWLDGIPELQQSVVVLGEGTDTEKNVINIPTSDFEPGVLINNTTYPIALQSYDDDTAVVALDKYQTLVTTISDDEAMGASYDTIDNATKGHTSALTSNKFIKAIHAICPTKDGVGTPVIATSGDNDGVNRKMLTRKDIIALKKKFDDMQCKNDGRRLVLCSDHVSDLLNTDQKFADQYYNYTTGKIANLYGFQVYEYIENPVFGATSKEKLSFGAIPAVGDYQVSVAFYAPNIAKKTGKTKQYFADAKTDPENQTNKLNYRHYFIAIPKRAKYIGAIMSAKV